MRRLVPLVLLGLASGAAGAREEDPQRHEVRVDIDLQTEREANGANIVAQYTWTPAALNRVDEVVPILRRFVRHPSALWVDVGRHGTTRETVTGGGLGGVLSLGRLYATGDVGFEYDSVTYDPFEKAYWAMPFTVEAGGRPIELLSVGAFFSGRKVLSAISESGLTSGEAALRGGFEKQFGLTLHGATPNDRIFATLSGWLIRDDWDFEGHHPGSLTVRGFGTRARVAYQFSSTFTFQVRGDLRLESWDNQRVAEEELTEIGTDLQRDIVVVHGDAEIIYWYRGRHGFRFGFGGGFEGAPPIVANRDTAVIRIGFGLITRF